MALSCVRGFIVLVPLLRHRDLLLAGSAFPAWNKSKQLTERCSEEGCDEPQQTFAQSDPVGERHRLGRGFVRRTWTGCCAVLFRRRQLSRGLRERQLWLWLHPAGLHLCALWLRVFALLRRRPR